MSGGSSPVERIAFWKDVKRQLIQQHDDIDRLWRLTDEMSLGVPFGGNGTITVTTTTSSTSSTTTGADCPCTAACMFAYFGSAVVDAAGLTIIPSGSTAAINFSSGEPGGTCFWVTPNPYARGSLQVATSGSGGSLTFYDSSGAPFSIAWVGGCNGVWSFNSQFGLLSYPSTVTITEGACP